MDRTKISKHDYGTPVVQEFLAVCRKIHRAGSKQKNSTQVMRDWLGKNPDLQVSAIELVRDSLELEKTDAGASVKSDPFEGLVEKLVAQQDEYLEKKIRLTMIVHAVFSAVSAVVVCLFLLAGPLALVLFFWLNRVPTLETLVLVFCLASLLPGLMWGCACFYCHRKSLKRNTWKISKAELGMEHVGDGTGASHRHWAYQVTSLDGETITVDEVTYNQIKSRLGKGKSSKRSVRVEFGLSRFLVWQMSWPPYFVE